MNTSCSLLHVPYTLRHEKKLAEEYRKHFAFAEEKLTELSELSRILDAANPAETAAYQKNAALFAESRNCSNAAVQEKVAALTASDFVRLPAFAEREKIQHAEFQLPFLPTTTIGSFRRLRRFVPTVRHSEKVRSPRQSMYSLIAGRSQSASRRRRRSD